MNKADMFLAFIDSPSLQEKRELAKEYMNLQAARIWPISRGHFRPNIVCIRTGNALSSRTCARKPERERNRSGERLATQD
jgi:hypothetical protein